MTAVKTMTVTSSARAVTVRAHAKINLDLRVLGTRPDGFHELRTVFQALALHDTIECVPRDGPVCDRVRDGRRAARSIESRVACGRSVVAIAASRGPRARRAGAAAQADSASGRARRWQRRCGRDARWPWRTPGGCRCAPISSWTWHRRLAPTFRSFCLAGRRSGSARGDEIYPLADLPRHWVVLLIPGFGVSTVDAYGWYDAERDTGRGSDGPRSRSTSPVRGRRAPRR